MAACRQPIGCKLFLNPTTVATAFKIAVTDLWRATSRYKNAAFHETSTCAITAQMYK